ncbi:MAG: metallophosphoesterase [Methanopyraceae archaeon]
MIGLISDTHDNLKAVDELADRLNNVGVEVVLHAGDYIAPFTIPELAKVECEEFIGVFGNNDGERDFLREKAEEVGFNLAGEVFTGEVLGLKVAMVHGHEEAVVEALARSGQYDVVVYGHTHEPEERKEGDTLVVNPGEACGYVTGRRTVAVLDPDELTVEIIEF